MGPLDMLILLVTRLFNLSSDRLDSRGYGVGWIARSAAVLRRGHGVRCGAAVKAAPDMLLGMLMPKSVIEAMSC